MTVTRINWVRAAAELVIIVAGVMLALAADRWRETERENDLALSYIARLQSDVETDLQAFRQTVEWAKAIDDSSLYVLDIYRGADPSSDSYDLFVYHIFRASWNTQGRTTSATYQDLIGTGNLGLLPVRIRNEVTDYYTLKGNYIQGRVKIFEEVARPGYWRVPDIVLGPILGPRVWEAIQGTSVDFAPEAGRLKLSDAGVAQIVQSLRRIEDLEIQISEVRHQMTQRKILFGERLPNAARNLIESLAAEGKSG